MTDKQYESRLRRIAAKQGYVIRKSRQEIHGNNLGEYRLIDVYMNAVVLGPRFDADLDQIVEFLEQ